MKMRTRLCALVATAFVASALAQTVSIPDAGLDSAIRDALQKPTGLLSEQDLLTLTNLNASQLQFLRKSLHSTHADEADHG
jgi:hypothetical protein